MAGASAIKMLYRWSAPKHLPGAEITVGQRTVAAARARAPQGETSHPGQATHTCELYVDAYNAPDST